MAEEKVTVQDEQLKKVTGGREILVEGTCAECGAPLQKRYELNGELYCKACFEKVKNAD